MGKFLDLAETILSQEERPLTAREISDFARERQYLDFSDGATPFQTIKARISEDIKRYAEKSRFKRVGKGIFALRKFDEIEYKAIPYEKKIKPKEDVLVFESNALDELGRFNGIKKKNFSRLLRYLLNKENTFFINRRHAEKDPKYKQILSYVLIKKDDKILRFVRGIYSNAHNMLKGRLCIGFGGHVQSSDFNLFSSNDNGYMNSVKRELYEELNLPDNVVNEERLSVVGILNDDSSQVGKVHIAIVHLLDLTGVKSDVIKGEKSINQLMYIPIRDLGKDFSNYEYWSKLCIKEFFSSDVKIVCNIHRAKNYELSKHPKVIVLVGAIGSGKTEAARILEKEYNYQMLSTGKILQQIMKVDPLSKLGRRKFQDGALKFIQDPAGPRIFADKILSAIDLSTNQSYVIDGVRNLKTFDYLKAALGKELTLIYVDSTVDNSFSFFHKREGKSLTIYDYYDYLAHPVESEINNLLAKANIVVYNHGSLKSFTSEIKKFFKKSLKI